MAPRSQGLQISEDMAFQRKSWNVQRAGWAFLVLVVITALLGFFGSGPFSHVTSGDGDGLLSVEHSRFARFEATTAIRVIVSGEAVRNGHVEVTISRRYLENVRLTEVLPAPQSVRGLAERTIFTFEGEEGTALPIILEVTPQQIGPQSIEIGLEGGPTVKFDQFIYP